MSEDKTSVDVIGTTVATTRAELETIDADRRTRIIDAIALAALSSIPWIGGLLSASATFRFNEDGVHADSLRTRWLVEHQKKLAILRNTLTEVVARIEAVAGDLEDRLVSEDYLGLVRKAFRAWDKADTEQKRRLIVQLITNAAGLRVCSDDILRLFLDWLETYHEAHFAVIRVLHKSTGPTRYDIWTEVYGPEIPRDDSAEADLYKMLIRDLTLGGVIRQARDSDAQGRFRKKLARPRRTAASPTMETPFEDTKQYVLTGLGIQFVHYTLNELVTRIESDTVNAVAPDFEG